MRIIRDHNTLNGLRFSVIEFLVMAVLVIGFAAYVAGAGSTVLALASLGVGANCLVVAAIGIGSLRAGEWDRGLAATFSRSYRDRILLDHPGAQRATWILTALTLVPFAVTVAALAEAIRRRA
ncbi:MAG: hypothetical protein ACHQZR_02705 [Candidatus Limnocylindrales bacterium]